MNQKKVKIDASHPIENVLLILAEISKDMKNSYITVWKNYDGDREVAINIPTGLPLEYYNEDCFDVESYSLKFIDNNNEIFFNNHEIEIIGDESFVDDIQKNIETISKDERILELGNQLINQNSFHVNLLNDSRIEFLNKIFDKYTNIYILNQGDKILHKLTKNEIQEIDKDIRIIFAFNNQDEYFVFDNEMNTICSNEQIKNELLKLINELENK